MNIDDDEYCCHPDEGGICLVMLYLLPGRYFATLSMTQQSISRYFASLSMAGALPGRYFTAFSMTAVNQQILRYAQYDRNLLYKFRV